jgi:hypothetical protein
MSLLDMINWSLFTFIKALQTLSIEMTVAAQKAHADPSAILSDEEYQRVVSDLDFITRECRTLLLESAEERLGRIYTGLRTGNRSYAILANELDVLGQAIEDGIRYERFYHYQRPKGL